MARPVTCGIRCITEVGLFYTGALEIVDCPALADLGGLAHLQTTGTGGLQLESVPAITSLAALDALTSVTGSVNLAGLTGVPAAEVGAFEQRLHH